MATHAFGTTFTWDGAVVGGLSSINGIELSAAMKDVSNHQSADAYAEFIAGMLSASDPTISGSFLHTDTTGQIAMVTDFNARASKTGVITFPSSTGTTWTFTAYVKTLKIGDAPIDGEIPFTASFQITGKPTLATSASTGLTTPFFAISESAVITPDAAGDVYTYVATVLTGVSSVTVTPTATAGTITVNGNTVATGVASSAITLGAAGSVTTITIVVTETGKSPKTYTIYLSRAAS